MPRPALRRPAVPDGAVLSADRKGYLILALRLRSACNSRCISRSMRSSVQRSSLSISFSQTSVKTYSAASPAAIIAVPSMNNIKIYSPFVRACVIKRACDRSAALPPAAFRRLGVDTLRLTLDRYGFGLVLSEALPLSVWLALLYRGLRGLSSTFFEKSPTPSDYPPTGVKKLKKSAKPAKKAPKTYEKQPENAPKRKTENRRWRA